MMPQITFWFSTAVEATDGLESCNVNCFWMISQHSHVILFLLWSILVDCFFGGMSRPQWGLLSSEWVLSHPIHRLR